MNDNDAITTVLTQSFGEILLFSIAVMALFKLIISYIESFTPSKLISKTSAMYKEPQPIYGYITLLYLAYFLDAVFASQGASLFAQWITVSIPLPTLIKYIPSTLHVAEALLFYKIVHSILGRFIIKFDTTMCSKILGISVLSTVLLWMINLLFGNALWVLVFIGKEVIVGITLLFIVRNWKKVRYTNFPLYAGATMIIAIPYYFLLIVSSLTSTPLSSILPYYMTALTGILMLIIADRDLGKMRLKSWK